MVSERANEFYSPVLRSGHKPFANIKSKIEKGEEPYEPPYGEDGMPPFQEEWMDADTSIQVIGRTCITMLSESVKPYFQTWEDFLGIRCQPALQALFEKRGFIAGYRECFRQVADINWNECPVSPLLPALQRAREAAPSASCAG